MKFVIMAVVVAVLLSGCAASPPRKTSSDRIDEAYKERDSYKVEHTYLDSLTDPMTVDLMYFYHKLFRIGVARNVAKDRAYNTLTVTYTGRKWLFMPGSVTIKIDDKVYSFVDKNPLRSVSGRDVYESISVTIPDELLKGMSEAKTLGIEFFGPPVYIDQKDMDKIGRFYGQFIAAH